MATSTLGNVMTAATSKVGTSILPTVSNPTPTISIVAQPAPNPTAQLPATTSVQLSVTPSVKALTSLTGSTTQSSATPVRISILPSPQNASSLVNPNSAVTQVVSVTPTTPVTSAKVTVPPSPSPVEKLNVSTTTTTAVSTSAITKAHCRPVTAGVQSTQTGTTGSTITVLPSTAITSANDQTTKITIPTVSTTSAITMDSTTFKTVKVAERVLTGLPVTTTTATTDPTLTKIMFEVTKANSPKEVASVKSENESTSVKKESAEGEGAMKGIETKPDIQTAGSGTKLKTEADIKDGNQIKNKVMDDLVKLEKEAGSGEPMDTSAAPNSSVNGDLVKAAAGAASVRMTVAPATTALSHSSTSDPAGKLISIHFLKLNVCVCEKSSS